MCGIVSAISDRNVVPILIDSLKRLEYRGYDSAGVAVINGSLHRLRAVGRVAELERLALGRALNGSIGVAHTRWATHGMPSVRNAHPHVSSGISVVHNGIIENHEALRKQLTARGYIFTSETDTEVIAHLIHLRRAHSANLFEAVRLSMRELHGSYAIAVIADGEPEHLIVARHGAPLLLGLGNRENFAASDVTALIAMTNRIVHLEDGDCAEVRPDGITIIDAAGQVAERPVRLSRLSAATVDRGPWQHFMQKEIFEQPAAVDRTLELIGPGEQLSPSLFGPGAEAALSNARSVTILACGTSYHAGLVARYWIESMAGIPCNVEIASEYRYRNAAVTPHSLIVTLSQSGETADTLAALEYARSLDQARQTLCICNVAESALVRASGLAFLTQAGPEIGVASTKAFTTQLLALFVLALLLARLQGRLDAVDEARHLQALRQLPRALDRVLRREVQIRQWARIIAGREHALFLGRAAHYPVALEGALKLKEISYIHAEAYAAGELKHGPLALVTPEMPVIAIAPRDALFEKLRSNLQEVHARGGELFVLADRYARIAEAPGIHVIRMPEHAGLLSPILHTLPLQLLAYHVAVERGNDVDKPRNLAKSVTVE